MKALWLTLLLGSIIWAEEDYFHIFFNARWNEYRFLQENLTWDEARNHCQACFNDLTTITSRNAHLVVLQNISLDFWTGLRKDNGSWSRWSNKDPITYQNWYPGHPIPNKVKKMIPVCFSTTQSPLSSAMTTSTSTPVTSTQTSTVTSTQTSTVTSTQTSTVTSPVTSSNKTEDVCPILYEILSCLNMTFDEFESTVHSYKITPTVTPKTTTYTTTPAATTFSASYSTATNSTTTESNTTESPTTESPTTESTTNSNCILVPEPDPEIYIEDACVVLLSNGMWKEKECNQSLPFICYDVHFVGEIDVSNESTRAANLSWSEAPGNITHYRVEITNKTKNFSTVYNVSGLYKRVEALTPGNLYNVQMFPVKCGRDLNPQNISFYTVPSGVKDLSIVSVTTVSIHLNWSKPEGDSDFYLVNVANLMNKTEMIEKTCKNEECNITGLSPGYEYEFIVAAVVNKTTRGVPMNISDYTMPSRVKNLKSADNDSTVITAFWEAPDGAHSGYSYCLKAYNGTDCTNCNTANCNYTKSNTIREEGKTDGTMYCLCVAALTKNDTLQGETVGISAYTRPKKVELSLTSNRTSITANWTIEGNYEKFKVQIETQSYISAGSGPLQTDFTKDFTYTFPNLKAGVMYNVTVVTVNGQLSSEPVIKSEYTRPSKPESLLATPHKNTITLTWTASTDSQGAVINYNVKYYSDFWKSGSERHTTDTTVLFKDLKTGTRYDFNVSVVAGNETSLPATAHCQTEPEKRTLILAMMCSSEKPLYCEQNKTDLFDALNNIFNQKFGDLVHWKLKWVERKEGSLN